MRKNWTLRPSCDRRTSSSGGLASWAAKAAASTSHSWQGAPQSWTGCPFMHVGGLGFAARLGMVLVLGPAAFVGVRFIGDQA